MTDEQVQVTYRGGPIGVHLLAQQFEEAGLSVSYEPPIEYRDAEGAAQIVRLVFEVVGDGCLIWEIVQRFKGQGGPRAPEVEAPPVPELTIEERLARLDDLLEKGVLTPEEHARQRARIQDESL